MSLTKKIDFALILKVTNANPNGDPLKWTGKTNSKPAEKETSPALQAGFRPAKGLSARQNNIL